MSPPCATRRETSRTPLRLARDSPSLDESKVSKSCGAGIDCGDDMGRSSVACPRLLQRSTGRRGGCVGRAPYRVALVDVTNCRPQSLSPRSSPVPGSAASGGVGAVGGGGGVRRGVLHVGQRSGRVDRPRPSKGSHHFLITVDSFEYYADIRVDFVSLFDSVVSYCVSIEKSSSGSRVSNHLHAYIEFSRSWLLADLVEYLTLCWPDCRYDVQSCKSPRDAKRYVSKEDWYLYTNVKTSSLHFNYQLHNWVTNTPSYRIDDPFVVANSYRYRFLEQYHSSHLKSLQRPFVGFRPLEVVKTSWCLSVALWWNDVISGFKHKRKSLFLLGPSDIGKSTFVEHMIGRENMRYVFYPGVGQFFMSGFDPLIHKVILFEEFDAKSIPLPHLKRLLEGSPYAYSVKCSSDKIIRFTGPIICVSNFYPDFASPMDSRFLFVSAHDAYYKSLSTLLVKTPPNADEVDSSRRLHQRDEVVLSSDEDQAWSECEYYSRHPSQYSTQDQEVPSPIVIQADVHAHEDVSQSSPPRAL